MLNGSSIVVARPHFRQKGADLFFFLSNRVFHSLSEKEAAAWERLERGPAALDEFADQGVIKTLADKGIVDVVIPVPATDRRKILVIEPHSDDAALSIGGTMWKMREEVEFHLLTIASRSNYTSTFQIERDYFERSAVTAMRSAEGELFMMHLAGHYHCAGMAEATLRYADSDWDLDYYKAHRVPIAISNNRRAVPEVLDQWVESLRRFLAKWDFQEIWIPLGAGTHSDHDLARNACLAALADRHSKRILRFYEDVPYAHDFAEHRDRILHGLVEAGAKLTPWFQDVTDVFPAKLSLLSIFASQFKVSAIQAGIEHSAGESADKRVEHLWTIDAMPTNDCADAIWNGAPRVAECRAALTDFLRGGRDARRVAIFAIAPAGRWRADMEQLKRAFPAARFMVYAGPQTQAELAAVQDERVTLRSVGGGTLDWVAAALRELSTSHRIIIAGNATDKARRLAMLWPTGRKIIVAAMDDLMLALDAGPDTLTQR